MSSVQLVFLYNFSPRSAVFKAWNSKPRGLEFESQQQHEKRNKKVMCNIMIKQFIFKKFSISDTTENSRNDDNSNPIPDSQDSGPPTTNHRSAVLNQSTKSYERNVNNAPAPPRGEEGETVQPQTKPIDQHGVRDHNRNNYKSKWK